jgi:hypothetical protein
MYRAMARVSGARVLVDSSKSPVFGALVGTLPLPVAYVHLVRDPRAIAHSWTRGKQAPGQNPRQEMWRMGPWRAGRAWILASSMGARVRRSGRPSLLLRYEDLAAHPRRAVEAIASLVPGPVGDLPFATDRTIDLAGSHTASGNPDRFRTGPVELRDDDAWRTDQRPLDRFTVTVMTLPLLHRFGYPVAVGRRGREGARA